MADNALIISNNQKATDFLREVLGQAFVPDISQTESGGEARRLLVDKDFDLFVINAPLSDEFGVSLAQNIALKTAGTVILLVKAELFDEISEKTEDYGIITLAKPLNRQLFWNALKVARAVHKKVRAAEVQNKKLLKKIEDIKIIDRAK